MKEVVCVPSEWTSTYEIEVLDFICPKCGHTTTCKKVHDVILSIKCKGCGQDYKLEYGFPEEIKDEYKNKNFIVHYPNG